MRLLLLEDNDLDTEIVVERLRAVYPDCEVVLSRGERDFLQALESGPYDAILSDYTLPGFDGSKALAVARSVCPDGPFLFFSGTIGEERAIEALRAGATDYVLKHHPDRLPVALDRALRERQERAARFRAEAEVRASEAQFRQMAASIPDMFWMASGDMSRIVYASPAAETILGMTCARLLESFNTWADVIHPDDRARVSMGALPEPAPAQLEQEYRIIRPDGRQRWVLDRRYPILSEDGTVAQISGLLEDITDRKRHELSLNTQFAVTRELAIAPSLSAAAPVILQALVNHLGWDFGCFWELDEQTGAFECLTRCSRPEVDGGLLERYLQRTLSDSASSLSGQVAKARTHVWLIDEVPADRSPANPLSSLRAALAFPILSGDRVAGVIELHSTKPQHRDAMDAEMVLAIGRQIGQFQQRRHAEERLHLLLNSTAEAIFGLDLHGRCTFVNRACLRLLGCLDASALLGESIHGLVHPAESGHSVAECPMYRVLLDPAGSHANGQVFRRADGSTFPVEYWSHPIKNRENSVGAVVTFLDITERRQLEEQLVQSQKMEAVGRLAGGVAHDFNNILTVMSGYSQFVRDAIPNESPVAKDVEMIQNSCRKAASLTRQLLAFSRKQVLQPRVIDLGAVAKDILKMLARTIGEDIRLEVRTEPDLGRVNADPGQMEQVLMNLAVNARDAMPNGGSLEIRLRNEQVDDSFVAENPGAVAGSHVVLSVTDTGHGMDEKTKARIFEPFFTTKDQGKGTGLGLATVYGIVAQSGGFLTVDSQVGVGTVFSVYLPRVEAPLDIDQGAIKVSKSAQTKQTVLLVDDSESVLLLAQRILELGGYSVLKASNGTEACSLSEDLDGPLHLIVTDIVMPGMNGRELGERVRQRHPEARVLYMSGYTSDAIARYGILDAAERLLDKPFTPQIMLQKVREVLSEQPR